MKQLVLTLSFVAFLAACGGRNDKEQKAYVDSLLHVISCSPTIVQGDYTLEDQLNACDLLMIELPDRKGEFQNIKNIIQHQIDEQELEEDILN